MAAVDNQVRRAGAEDGQVAANAQFAAGECDRAGDGEVNRGAGDGGGDALPQRAGAAVGQLVTVYAALENVTVKQASMARRSLSVFMANFCCEGLFWPFIIVVRNLGRFASRILKIICEVPPEGASCPWPFRGRARFLHPQEPCPSEQPEPVPLGRESVMGTRLMTPCLPVSPEGRSAPHDRRNWKNQGLLTKSPRALGKPYLRKRKQPGASRP